MSYGALFNFLSVVFTVDYDVIMTQNDTFFYPNHHFYPRNNGKREHRRCGRQGIRQFLSCRCDLLLWRLKRVPPGHRLRWLVEQSRLATDSSTALCWHQSLLWPPGGIHFVYSRTLLRAGSRAPITAARSAHFILSSERRMRQRE